MPATLLYFRSMNQHTNNAAALHEFMERFCNTEASSMSEIAAVQQLFQVLIVRLMTACRY